MRRAKTVLVVMGVCGAGKSVLAALLADRLGLSFIEADDYHSAKARMLMSQGRGLTDEQRLPWLDRVGEAATKVLGDGNGLVIACSALRRLYRDRLRDHLPMARFVFLTGDRELIAERLSSRRDHFVGLSLLDSQLETIEPLADDEAGIALDVDASPEVLADQVLTELGR